MRALCALASLAGWTLPSVAAACPACARDTSPWAPYLIGSMLLIPFAVAAVVVRIVRRGEMESRS